MKKIFTLFMVSLMTLASSAEDLTQYINDNYDGKVLVNVNDAITGPSDAKVTITKKANNTIDFTLKNFVMWSDGIAMPVGNVSVTDMQLQSTETEGKVSFTMEKTIVLEDGDDPEYGFWMASMLPPVPIVLRGEAAGDYMDIDISIDMQEAIGQMIFVDAYAGEKEYKGKYTSTIGGSTSTEKEGKIAVTTHMDFNYDITLKDVYLDIPGSGSTPIGDMTIMSITSTDAGNDTRALNCSTKISVAGAELDVIVNGTLNGSCIELIANVDASAMGMGEITLDFKTDDFLSVDNISVNKQDKAGAIFNLSGQKVSFEKGLIIKNGKKVLVK